MLFLLCFSISFAHDKNESKTTENKKIEEVVKEKSNYECSVTSSGVIHSAEYGDIPMTLTVTGPCDSSLAQIMRDKIAEIRAKFGDTQ